MANKKNKIPEFKSLKEEAEFWDTHDTTDFDFKPIKVKVAKNLKHIFSVRFEGKTLSDLDAEASKKGLGTGALIRMWIKERLEEEQAKQAPV
jgi:predicted DNA binding CopG/RHH family protein